MIGSFKILPRVDIAYIDALLLDGDGRMRLLSAAELRAIDHVHLQVWAASRARYGIPTLELVTWLRDRIGARRAIEIGAGMGDLGRLLPIPMTDSAIQSEHSIRAQFAAMEQPITEPPSDVVRIAGNDAVRKYKPSVVVASWVTHRYRQGDEGGFTHGVAEETLLDRVRCYIHIGNENVHRIKPLLRRPHEEVRADWIVSRHANQADNVIWIWDR